MNKSKAQPDISNTEFEVLDVIWDSNPISSNEVIDRLNQHKPWHEKTVKTLLGRLVKKGAISFHKQQRQYLYYPIIAREEYVQEETSSFLSRLFKGKVAPMIAGFANQNELSKEDIDELKAVIKQWEQNND